MTQHLATEHLSPAILNALADGELTAAQLASAQQHLAVCPQCTTAALTQTMLKTATAGAGHRFTAPQHLQENIQRQIQQDSSRPRTTRRFSYSAWAAAAMFLVCISLLVHQRSTYRAGVAANDTALANEALASEAIDQHIATLAANAPPQVLSSDRHTVKPWFQGKLPFSFNLPENLPSGTTLDGANLTYFHNQPTALLLYSIGKHRVSVFIRQKTDTATSSTTPSSHAGFNVTTFTTSNLAVVAVSDVDPAHLSDLTNRIEQAQSK